jgi:hypothetical protein
VHRIATTFLSLLIAASMGPASAVGSDHPDIAKANICEVGADKNKNQDLSRAALDVRQRSALSDGARMEGVRKIENVPIALDGAGKGREARRLNDGVGETRQDTRLALLQNTPHPLQDTSRARDSSHATGARQDADWARMTDNPMPEPGTWAMLIAGFLGICAVARPRIFTS